MLHYTCPPVIGGVETILYEQAKRLAARGHAVTVISGRGGPLPDSDGLRLDIIPELDSRDREVTLIRESLLQGEIPESYAALRDRIQEKLRPIVEELDVLIVHNALSLHFNLSLTAALWSLAQRPAPRIISWIHDLSWVNPLYRPRMHEGEPWNFLKRADPRIRPIFVSRQRMEEWRGLTGAHVERGQVVPNGIDAAKLLRLGPASQELAEQLHLLAGDVILLAPVRITRRKQLEWAIEAAAGVRDSGERVQLLITGPPGPHDPHSMDYVAELKALTLRHRLEGAVHFLFERTADEGSYAVDTATLSDLYMLSDVVVLPSESEGFGLPLAEAAILRTPVVCTDIPAFLELAPEGVVIVQRAAGSVGFTAGVLQAVNSPRARLRRHVLEALSWDRLISERIEPLLA